MKKLIAVVAVSLLGAIPALCAQPTQSEFAEGIGQRIIRFIRGHENVDWVYQVSREERRLTPGVTGASYYTFSTKSFTQQKVHESDRETFESHKALINKYLAKNHTLGRYTLVVPIPSDLAALSKEDVNYLIRFLRQPKDKEHFDPAYTPYSVTLVEKAVVEIKLLTPSKNILILRVDSLKSVTTDEGLKKVVYFFLNEY